MLSSAMQLTFSGTAGVACFISSSNMFSISFCDGVGIGSTGGGSFSSAALSVGLSMLRLRDFVKAGFLSADECERGIGAQGGHRESGRLQTEYLITTGA